MSRQEKRRRFNEAVINMLYPPPSPPPQAKDEDSAVNNYDQVFDADLISGDFGESSSSSTSDDGESESQKLTRAQRKRLRIKKLKTEASRRRGIIGPLLRPTDDNDNGGGDGNNLAFETCSPTVRCNASEGLPLVIDQPGDSPTCAKNQSKVKQRRLAKKLARKDLSSLTEEKNCDEDQSMKSYN